MRPSESLSALLDAYQPRDDGEALHIRQLRQFLTSTDNAYDRSNLVAHIVADGWVLNQDHTRVLLVERGETHAWLAPGGHCDGNPDTWAQAVREVAEETGLTDLKPLGYGLFDINVHFVPLQQKKHGIEPKHLHFNVCFAFVADDSRPLTVSDESHHVAWQDIANLPNINFWDEHFQRVIKTQEKRFL